MKRLAITVAAGATVLGAMGLTAPAASAAVKPAAVTCDNHHVKTDTTRSDYYGNCTDAAMRIHVWLMYYPPLTIPTVTDEGEGLRTRPDRLPPGHRAARPDLPLVRHRRRRHHLLIRSTLR